jgi:glycoprotein-N-acetylgalactosamine 3-beta-galactosyltransferase
LNFADESQDIIGLPIEDTYDNLWGKTKAAFQYVYEHHYTDADFFLKADDDTFVILENLRLLLSSYSPLFPVYFGCKFKRYVEKGFMSGGAGYVLSKEALNRFIVGSLANGSLCKAANSGVEDMELGYCMQVQNVLAIDTRDDLGRGRFFPMSVQDHIMDNTPEWYSRYLNFPLRKVSDCVCE